MQDGEAGDRQGDQARRNEGAGRNRGDTAEEGQGERPEQGDNEPERQSHAAEIGQRTRRPAEQPADPGGERRVAEQDDGKPGRRQFAQVVDQEFDDGAHPLDGRCRRCRGVEAAGDLGNQVGLEAADQLGAAGAYNEQQRDTEAAGDDRCSSQHGAGGTPLRLDDGGPLCRAQGWIFVAGQAR